MTESEKTVAENVEGLEEAVVAKPLPAFCERVNHLDDAWHTFDEANTSALVVSFFGLPFMAWLLNWYGGWASLGFGLGLAVSWGIFGGVMSNLPQWIRARISTLLAVHFVPLGAFGWWSSQAFEPAFAGPAFAGALALIVGYSTWLTSKEKREDKAHLHLAEELVRECRELPISELHPDVSARLEQAVIDRQESLRALMDSLGNDPSVNRFAILAEVDAALAALMNRAAPVSALLNRTVADEAAQKQAKASMDNFITLSDKVHETAVSLLAYASSPEESVLEVLRARADDLRGLDRAHREIESMDQAGRTH